MRTALIFIFLYLFIPYFVLSKNRQEVSNDFETIYYHIAVNESSTNPLRALYMADSLYASSVNNKQRLLVLMLKADILEKQEKRGEAIEYAQQALYLAEKERDYDFQARIYGFLSTQYRTIGYFDKGKESIEKGLEISFKIKNKDQLTKYKAMANHELAEYALEEKDYKKAIECSELARLSYEQEEDESLKYFFLANIEEVYGRAYWGLNDLPKTKQHLARADFYINKSGSGNTLWAALIYQKYAKVFLQENKLDKALLYINKALSIAEKGKNGSLKEKVYKTAADYYQQIKNTDSFVKYDEKFNKVLEENNSKKKEMVNQTYQIFNSSINKKSKSKNKFLYISVILLLLIVTGIFIVLSKKMFFNKSIKENETKTKSYDINLSEKTENEILDKLKEFEVSKAYLDKNISMSLLIGILNTNTKYLRYILKKYKQTDYANYINQLRINYILNKLKTDPEYLNYKIGYLAEECGFSSHSKFSSEFKQFVGVTPSEFINNLKNINND